MKTFTSLELCAGGGGQALGIEQAGFRPLALVDNDKFSCATLRLNRPDWNVLEQDLETFCAAEYRGKVDLLAAGVPCPPFSKAGLQKGQDDERNLFPHTLRIIAECQPKAVMLENVRGLLDPIFDVYRSEINQNLCGMGYSPQWKLLNACDFGVPQLRPRVVCVAIQSELADGFCWSLPMQKPPTVGETLLPLMQEAGWQGAETWARQADRIAPTLVGGSKKHGGPDLGPTRARQAWAALGVNGIKIGDAPPAADFEGMPLLTVEMAALIQGFPTEWQFAGKKTAAYRQVGNAFPPPVARAIAIAIGKVITQHESRENNGNLPRILRWNA